MKEVKVIIKVVLLCSIAVLFSLIWAESKTMTLSTLYKAIESLFLFISLAALKVCVKEK